MQNSPAHLPTACGLCSHSPTQNAAWSPQLPTTRPCLPLCGMSCFLPWISEENGIKRIFFPSVWYGHYLNVNFWMSSGKWQKQNCCMLFAINLHTYFLMHYRIQWSLLKTSIYTNFGGGGKRTSDQNGKVRYFLWRKWGKRPDWFGTSATLWQMCHRVTI